MSDLKRIVVSAFLIDRDGRFLIGRRRYDGLYCTPGGKVEVGETLTEALSREVREECDLQVSPHDLERFDDPCDLDDKLIFFYSATSWVGRVRNRERDKHHPWQWVDDLPTGELVEGLRWFRSCLRDELQGRLRERRCA